MKTVNHKCPNCDANLNYNPKNKNWVCDYCGSKFTLDELKANEANYKSTSVAKSEELKKDNSNKKQQEIDEYICEDCGAKIIADKNTSATFCVYCKNTAILKGRLTDKFEPIKIIPFTKVKQDAIDAFKKVGKGKFLMPKDFSDSKNIQELTGIYIPFWLYSCKGNGHFSGKGKRVTTWTTSDYIYTKTDTYDVVRDGEYEFSLIPVDGSIRFNDAIMNSIEPFNYDELIDFNYSYLSGFLAEKYDIEKDEAKKITIDRAKNTAVDDLRENAAISFQSVIPETNTFTTNEENIEYVLLPVWMVNIKYKDKMYTFAMNGQTGKMIGDIPYSTGKACIYFIVLFLIIFAVFALIFYFI